MMPFENRKMLAYLFEKFPSFSQTFCAREVMALRRAGVEFPVYSIRHPHDEPRQDELAVGPVTHLPEKFDDLLASDTTFRRAARCAQDKLRTLWGCEKEKRRIYEALWLGPRLRETGVEHVHVHFAGTAARTAFWLNQLFGIRFSITAHANDIFRDEPPERLAQMFAAATVVVTVSDFSVHFLRDHYPASRGKFCRVYNGIETGRFPEATFPDGPPEILSVGRYIEKKGFADLIDACARMADTDFVCRIVGHGPLADELQARADRLGIGDRVTLTGPKTESEICSLLASARVFVLPCVNASDGAVDNLPTVIMEAMAAGVPVVSTAVAGVPEMVRDGETGFVVPEKNPDGLARSINLLLGDKNLARRMGQEGRAHCADRFDSRQTTASLLEVFRTHGAIAS